MNTAITPKVRPDGIPSVPVNGQPMTLVETVEHEALAYRAWRTPEGDFLASHLERLAQLIRWTGATTPDEHEARMEVWDSQIAERHFDRGFTQGDAAARNHHGLSLDDRY
jgi:hypothetical protein